MLMVECDRINISVPEGEQDVAIETRTCGIPDSIDEISPGDTIRATVGAANEGADTGAADIVINAIPVGVDPDDNPEAVVELGRETGFVLPGESSDVAIFDVVIPQSLNNGEYRVATSAENQRAGRID